MTTEILEQFSKRIVKAMLKVSIAGCMCPSIITWNTHGPAYRHVNTLHTEKEDVEEDRT